VRYGLNFDLEVTVIADKRRGHCGALHLFSMREVWGSSSTCARCVSCIITGCKRRSGVSIEKQMHGTTNNPEATVKPRSNM
jgi:hypothetical protein